MPARAMLAQAPPPDRHTRRNAAPDQPRSFAVKPLQSLQKRSARSPANREAVVQSFRRDIFGGSPNDTPNAPTLRPGAGKTEVADFCRVFVDKQNISRLHIAVNQTSPVRGTQSLCNLNANLEDPFFR